MSDTPLVDSLIYPTPGSDAVTGEPIEVVHAEDARAIELSLRAEIWSLTVLHPRSEHRPGVPAIFWTKRGSRFVRAFGSAVRKAPYWTHLPQVKEAL